MMEDEHISVCICTYKRPELLRQLLSKLEEQETEGFFDYSIVIVDNDRSESARQTVVSCIRQSKISISYYVEPEQNIALARNKAIENSKGDFIGFIDDDEFPSEHWLLNLYKAVKSYKSDGILSPVLPYFERKPPRWVLKGRFFDRPTHPTGHILEWKNTRTGNALLRRELFKEDGKWFDPAFGSGGEDRDFFRRMIEKDNTFIWCNEAPVYEFVPTERCKRSFMLRRALLRGKVSLIQPSFSAIDILKSVIAVSIYTTILPVFFLIGHHWFMKYLVKDFDHIGRLMAVCCLDVIKEKYILK